MPGSNVADNVQEEFARWLSATEWSWTHFLTLTYRRPRTTGVLNTTRKLAQYTARTANGLWGFCFQEPHRDGRTLHAHCLWSIQPNLLGSPKEYQLWEWWHRRYGRNVIDRLKPSKDRKACLPSKITDNLANYLCKYISKCQDRGEWDFVCFSGGKEWTCRQFMATQGLVWPDLQLHDS